MGGDLEAVLLLAAVIPCLTRNPYDPSGNDGFRINVRIFRNDGVGFKMRGLGSGMAGLGFGMAGLDSRKRRFQA